MLKVSFLCCIHFNSCPMYKTQRVKDLNVTRNSFTHLYSDKSSDSHVIKMNDYVSQLVKISQSNLTDWTISYPRVGLTGKLGLSLTQCHVEFG